MLRMMIESDIDSIVNLENDTLGETLGCDMLKDILTNPLMKAYCYELDENILGYISVSFDGQILEILNFCVDKNYQNKKIGKRLLNYAIIDNYKLGCESVILEVRSDNLCAIHVYESFGFKMISKRKQYYKDLCDALVYELKLPNVKALNNLDQIDNVKKIETNDYIKYYDDYQNDKYYHNYYEIINEECINDLIKENKNKPFLCFEYGKKLNIKGFDEIDDNIIMASFIKGIIIDKKRDNIDISNVNELNKNEVYDFLYNDSLMYGEEYAKKDTNVIINLILKNITDGYIIKNNNKIIGFVNIIKYNNVIEIDHFFIDDNYQRNGYGSSLINYVINKYYNEGYYMAILTADNDDSPKDMYSKWGFIKISESYFIRRGK